MRVILWIFAIWQVCAAGRLQILLPDNHAVENDRATFDSNSLLEFNKKALGIKTGPGTTPSVSGAKLFEKPKALLVISINGLDDFIYDGHMFNFTDNFQPQIQDHLKDHFGNEMMQTDLNSSGIFSSSLAKRNIETPLVNGVETVNQDIQNMHTLAKLIKEKDRKSANVVDYYRIHLDVSNARSALEKHQLEENVKKGIDTLQQAIKDSYGGNVIAEIYTHEQVSENAVLERLIWARRGLSVTRPVSQDYPAIFAINFLVCSVLFLAVTSMIWFMIDEGDMGKNSLVYRLSTGRQKKD